MSTEIDEHQLRATLHARAEDVVATPHLYRQVERRIGRRRRLRIVTWSTAATAAVLAAAVALPQLVGSPTPDVAEVPGPDEVPSEAYDPVLPDAALVGDEDGALAIYDIDRGQRRVISGSSDGPVTAIATAPGATRDHFRAVVTRGSEVVVVTGYRQVRVEDGTTIDEGGVHETGVSAFEVSDTAVPQVAIAPDGESIAVLRDTASARAEVRLVPLAPDGGPLAPDGEPLVDQATTVATVADGEQFLDWTGDAGDGTTRLRVATATGEVAVLTLDDDRLVDQDQTPRTSPVRSSSFLSPGDDQDLDWVLDPTGGAADRGSLRFEVGDRTVASVPYDPVFGVLGVLADEARIDVRGRRALVVGGGTAALLTRDDPSESEAGIDVEVTATLDDVTAGSLLGGFATRADAGTSPAAASGGP